MLQPRVAANVMSKYDETVASHVMCCAETIRQKNLLCVTSATTSAHIVEARRCGQGEAYMTLEILDWHDGDLLAKPVFDKLNELVAAGVPESKILGVTINTDEESDTDLWCPKYGIPFEITGNVVVVHTHKRRRTSPPHSSRPTLAPI